MRCVNDYETVDVDSYLIKQVMDCRTKFTANSPSVPTFLHDPANPVRTIGDMDFFFTNTEPIECPLTCVLKQDGCSIAYLPGQVFIDVSSPFLITASANIEPGYSETICVECSNPGEILTVDSVVVNQKRDCLNKLTSNSPLNQTFLFDYNGTQPTELLGDWTFFFTNIEPLCDSSYTCTLKAEGCVSSYVPGHVTIGGSLPFNVRASKNIDAGHNETFCIQCVNDYELLTLDSYYIKQVMNCSGTFHSHSPIDDRFRYNW